MGPYGMAQVNPPSLTPLPWERVIFCEIVNRFVDVTDRLGRSARWGKV